MEVRYDAASNRDLFEEIFDLLKYIKGSLTDGSIRKLTKMEIVAV